ncbi:MAG: peptidoglycan DD-metalloendopeptidase family protein [Nitrosospira sp.]
MSQPETVLDAAGQPPNLYIVQKGDTLYSIALNHGIDQKDLAQWNNIQDPGAIHIGQQLSLSSPFPVAQPSLFPLPEPVLPPSAGMAPNAVPPFEEKHMANTDKLKVEPKAFKLPYSEQAVALLKGGADVPPMAILKADPAAEKKADAGTGPVPPVAEALRDDDRIEWIWPVKGKVLEGFSESTKGIDIAGKSGQPVSASAAGKVVYSGAGLRGYGKLIIIKHNPTYLSAYAHNDKLLVKEGQTVAKGQKIAEMGSTDTNLVKLHFEIRKNGKPVDPLKHLPGISG